MPDAINHFRLERSTDGSTFDVLADPIGALVREWQDTERPDPRLFYKLAAVTDNGVEIPYNVVKIAIFPFPEFVSALIPIGIVRDVCAGGDFAYITDKAFGLTAVDISVPDAPVIVGSSNLPFDGYSVAVSDTIAVVTGTRTFYSSPEIIIMNNGFYIIDLSVPSTPRVIGRIETNDFSFGDLAVSGNYAYVASGWGGMKVIDISNPAAPVVVGSYAQFAIGVTVAGNYAYLACEGFGMRVVDISNPAAPVGVSLTDTPGGAKHIVVAGTLAYLADYNSLRIFDVSNPSAPSIMGTLAIPAYRVAVQNGIAYVAAQSLTLVDVSNPASPMQLGTIGPARGSVQNVFVSGSLAYLACYDGGLEIVDVSNPALPFLKNSILTTGAANSVTVQGNYAYVGANPGVINVIAL